MVRVKLWGSLANATGGLTEVDVEASTTREMLTRLSEAYPGLKPQIERGVSVAIDGTIYKEAWFTPLKPENEIVLLPYMTGG